MSFYARQIIPAASPTDDYVYVLTPFSIYLIRMEKNRVTEIQTSSIVKAIADHFSTDPYKKLTTEKPEGRDVPLDYTTNELKLDGPCRVVSMPGHKVLVCSEKGEFTMIQLKFDQADIDVA